MDYRELALFIDGQWDRAGSENAVDVINPADETVLGRLPSATPDHIERALRAAERAFRHWRMVPPEERRRVLNTAGDLLLERMERIALSITLEQGKPLAESRREIERTVGLLKWYGEEAGRLTGNAFPPRTDQILQRSVPEPVGVVAAFTAWNLPLVLAGRKLAMALAAGCTIVLKAAEETPASAMALVEALRDAGLPPGCVNLVFGRPAEIAGQLLASPIIRKVTLTGSIPVGKELARLAAKGMKPASMELGGHSPALIFEDADVERAASQLAAAKFANAGQICTTPSRLYAHAGVYDRFRDAFVAKVKQLRVGNGIDPHVDMGPVAHSRRLSAMKAFVADASARGADVLTGGARLPGSGYFFAPTVLSNVPPEAAMMREEYFGPLAAIASFESEEEAVRLANSLPYGLAAYVFTASEETASRMEGALESGGVFVNTTVTVAEYTPFCGVKESGYGYEGGREGLDSFLHYKLVNRGPA